MANVQAQFEQFHETIKLSYDENSELAEKRDRIINRLKEGIKKLFEEKNEPAPKFTTFNQGSYAMHTGVKPVNGDYDIDVGVRFSIAKNDYPDPVEVKGWVYEALKKHTRHVEIRRPCVTVYYTEQGEDIYHVDLAIYSGYDTNSDGNDYLAKGKPHSSEENKVWEVADPQGLIDLIANRFGDPDDAKQFRRIIRYLKRWRDVKFSSSGNAAPVGIGLTLIAYNWFTPAYSISDPFKNTRRYRDLDALLDLVKKTINQFTVTYFDDEWAERLVVELPVVPYTDVFARMTNKQMGDFRSKLQELRDVLISAEEQVDPVEACKELQGVFGDDFPVPKKEETARKVSAPIVSSSTSA